MKNFTIYATAAIMLVSFGCNKADKIDAVNLANKSQNPEVITLHSGIQVVKSNNNYYLDGDILLTPEQLKCLDENGSLMKNGEKIKGADTTVNPVTGMPLSLLRSGSKTLPRNFGINADPYRLWAMVRFTFGSSILNDPNAASLKATIGAALHQMESVTNVRFYNATGQPTVDPVYGFAYPYVEFNYVNDPNVHVSSSSLIGRNPNGGKQTITLAPFAFQTFLYQYGIIIHEVCHTIGMYHEAKRPDRNNYVTVNSSNLTSLGAAQFQIINTNYSYIGAYDFNSVMGYSSSTSATEIVYNTSLPMYTKINGDPIEQGQQLSNLDRSWINYYQLPYIARSDVYRELADTVYNSSNVMLTAQQRLQLQSQLNNGNPTPPAGGRIPNNF